MRRPVFVLLVGLAGLGLGCSDECDCPLGGTCEADGRCSFECSSAADCPAVECAADDACCDDQQSCLAHQCQARTITAELCGAPPAAPEDNEGWSDPVGVGEAYVVSRLVVTPVCEGCANAFDGLEYMYDQHFSGQIVGGRTRLLLEVHGRDAPEARFDRSLTVALYPGRDYDDPVLIDNDFRSIPGGPTCCEFYPEDITPGPEAPTPLRAAAQLVRGVLTTNRPAEEVALPYFLNNDVRSLLRLREMTLTARTDASGTFTSLDIEGRVLPGDLWQMLSAMCVDAPADGPCPRSLPEGARVLDLLFAAAGPPDVDRDGDGLECLLDLDDDGGVDTCCDGGGPCSPSCTPIPPVHASEPSSCALDPRMQDGWTVRFTARLVPATVYPSP